MIRFLCALGTALLFTTAVPLASALAAPAAARVLFVSGEAERLAQDGRTHALMRGDEVFNGDVIQTRKGMAQLKFGDGGFVSVQHDSRFRIAEYFYGGQEDGTEHAIFELLKGGIRALSGAIGHQRRERYQMRTVVATIGIRGTAYSALFCQRDCAIEGGTQLPDGLHAKTTEGAIVLQNQAGELAVPAGAAAFVSDQFSMPVPSTFEPSFARAAPAAPQKQATDKGEAQSTAPAANTAADQGQQDTAATIDGTAGGDQTKSTQTSVGEIRNSRLEQRFDQRWTGGVDAGGKVRTLEPTLPAPTTEVLIGSDQKSGKFDDTVKQEIRDLKTFDASPTAGDSKGAGIELPPVPVLIDDRIDRDSIKLQPQLSPDLFNNNDLDKSGSGKLLQ